jgi:Fe-S-cluster containining protein
MGGQNFECSCDSCQGACRYRPGWFRPDEIEPAARLLGLTVDDFFHAKLAIDWWEADEDIFLLAPAIQGHDAGTEYPADPRGVCTFFKHGLCEIHAAKPFECRALNHTDTDDDVEIRHRATLDAWAPHQKMIEDLLGRKPEAVEFYGGSILDMFFN